MSDLEVFVQKCESIRNRNPKLLSKAKPVLLFGAGNFGRDVASLLKKEGYIVLGFVDSNPKSAEIEGLRVVRWDDINDEERRAQLVIAIFNRDIAISPLRQTASDHGFEDIYLPWDIYQQFGVELGWRFWLDKYDVILKSLEKIKGTYSKLSDDESRTLLLDICLFRLGIRDEYSELISDAEQYFNSITMPYLEGRDITYVDGGAYNGDTYRKLSGLVEIKRAFLFEPDKDNFIAMQAAVAKSSQEVVCSPLALSDDYKILSFNSGAGEGAAVSAAGDAHIAATSLDAFFHGVKVDFIKMDVEGSEIDAIEGSRNLIGEFRPVLAISLYHKAQDLWDIPEKVMQITDSYDFYIRQHAKNSFDSVLYAIPKA